MRFILFILVLVLATSCSKDVVAPNQSPEQVFMRVQEVSNDNVASYSPVVIVTLNQ